MVVPGSPLDPRYRRTNNLVRHGTVLIQTADDVIEAHVFLDPERPPKMVMLQVHTSPASWEHRAYWGGNNIDWGKDKTASRKHMGDLPETGKWARLEVEPASVGLKPGEKLNGWAYTQFDGKVYWDKSGLFSTVDPAKDPAHSW